MEVIRKMYFKTSLFMTFPDAQQTPSVPYQADTPLKCRSFPEGQWVAPVLCSQYPLFPRYLKKREETRGQLVFAVTWP